MRHIAGAFIWGLLILSTACMPSGIRQPAALELPGLADWPGVYRANYESLHSLQSQVRITVESPTLATNFNASLIFAAPDTLFIRAEGPLGIDVGKIFIGAKRFIFFNQYNNQFLSGSLDETYYNTFLETHLTLSEIREAALGYAPPPSGLKLVDQQHGIFAALVGNRKWRFEVEPRSGLLSSFEIRENNRTVFKQEFQRYRLVDGIVFPALTRVILPEKNEMVAIFHKNIKINQAVNPGTYRIVVGPKVEQLIIGE